MTDQSHAGRRTLAALVAGFAVAALPASPALAAGAVNAGDTAWMLMASALVMLMTIPGLALFYSGLVRTKNTISMLMQVLVTVCAVCLIWIMIGYSLTFTGGSLGNYIGGLSRAMLQGIDVKSVFATYPNGDGIPEYARVAFQMTFACVTPAILVGAFAERMRFAACLLFVVLWVLVVYIPIAHMAWYAPPADVMAAAAKAVAQASTPDARSQADAALAALNDSSGLFVKWGAIDFAGGLVVHTSAGIAGLVGALIVGKRVGYGRDSMAPHSLAMTMMGGALLWVGWFGFNAGSALKADGTAALAMLNTFVAASSAAVAWMCIEMLNRGKPSLVGLVSGILAGLVAVTPAAGYAGPVGALSLGMLAGAVCYWFCTFLKARLDYDDALDVFGVHCVAGILGTLAVGVLVSPTLGGTGLANDIDPATQFIAQSKAALVTLAWSSFASSRLYALVDSIVGLRLPEDEEDQGLDVVEHGERAYNY
ncbi:MAG: ammonium transporter [Hyphomicrobium sp.]